MFDALQDCLRDWQAGTMDVPSFDASVDAGRAGYAALVGVPADSVTMAGTVSSALGLVAAVSCRLTAIAARASAIIAIAASRSFRVVVQTAAARHAAASMAQASAT